MAPGQTYNMKAFHSIYINAVENGQHRYDTANFSILMQLVFPRCVTRKTSDKNQSSVTLITGVKASNEYVEQHESATVKRLFVRSN